MIPSTSVSAGIAPLKVGVAGLGKMGMHHIERLGLRDDFRIVAVHDHCPQAAERLPPGEFRFCAEWRELIHDPEVELVLIATPPAAHAAETVSALHAGKHVVVETPFCLAADEADAVLAAEARTGRVVSVAHTRRWDDDFLAAQSALAEGILGTSRSIRYVHWHFAPRRRRLSGMANIPEETSPDRRVEPISHWRDDRATGGGMLWEFGVHLFDQLLQLTDEQPVKLFAKLVPSAERPAIDDAFLAVVEFDGGLTACLDVNRASPAPLSTGWVIAGDAGSFAGGTQYLPTPEGEIVDIPQSCAGTALDDYYGALVQRIRRNEPNPVSAAQARRSIVLVNAARQSAACGMPVPVEL